MRLCFTINGLFRASNRFEIRLMATASPIPVYSSGQFAASALAPETLVAAGLAMHSPATEGLLTTSTVGTSESRNRFHRRDTSAGVFRPACAGAAIAAAPHSLRWRSAENSSAAQTKAVTSNMSHAVLSGFTRLGHGGCGASFTSENTGA